jgi:bacillithiol biosynthesis cysteine-adding enzyme BshC
MPCSCLRHTELPHTTKLFSDLIYHFDRVQTFYHYPPLAPDSFAAAAAQVHLTPEHRAKLVAALARQNSGSKPALRHSLERLSQPDTLVVASGQQVGLFTGPVFTIYKALSAARLAEELTQRGIPAVPVFWLATEDHDLEEVKHVWVFDAKLRPVRLEASADATGQPVGEVQLKSAATAELRAALADFPFGTEIGGLAAESYADGATFASGFKALFARLLASHGVLALDPQSPDLRQLAAPVVAQAIERAPELTAALLARGKELEARGYHTQVHMEEKTSLFFLMEEGRRRHLWRSGDSYAGNGATYSRAELLQRLNRRPEDFSSNALLRPVVQDHLLPTVAYIGGPAELAYLAQAEVLYKRLLGRMPVALPRASFTILDPRAHKLLERYHLAITDAMHGLAPLQERIASSLIPASVQEAFRSGGEQIDRALDAVRAQLLNFDPTLADALSKSRSKIEHQFSKIQAKAARETLRRSERALAEASYLSNLIHPEKTLQERLYSVLPFLARHGLGLLEQLYGAIRFDCPDHQVLVVS